jgi:3-oxoacyl-[acyl-carrier-protein] synthase-3
MFIPLKLISTGKALPRSRVTSAALDEKLGYSAGYVFKRSGVRSRYLASKSESQSQLGALALQDALKNACLKPGDIDLLIAACAVGEQALPNTGCFIAAHAGLSVGTPAFDVNASCLSFLVGLNVASSLLNTHAYRRIALVSADVASRGLNWDDPEASLIFGDGAAAVILEKGAPTQGIRAYQLETYTSGRHYCEIRAGGSRLNPNTGSTPPDYLFHMDGKAVFKLAAKEMPAFLDKLLDRSASSMSDIDIVVPHQASPLGLIHAAKKLGVPEEKIVKIFETHGNQVAASIPTALHEAVMTGRAKAGSRVLMMGTAAGLTLGGMVLDL